MWLGRSKNRRETKNKVVICFFPRVKCILYKSYLYPNFRYFLPFYFLVFFLLKSDGDRLIASFLLHPYFKSKDENHDILFTSSLSPSLFLLCRLHLFVCLFILSYYTVLWRAKVWKTWCHRLSPATGLGCLTRDVCLPCADHTVPFKPPQNFEIYPCTCLAWEEKVCILHG